MILYTYFDKENGGGDEEEENADLEYEICGKVIHPETHDDASSLDAENFSNDNQSDHEEKPHHNPMEKSKL